MNIITIDAAQIGCTDAPLLLGYAGENSVEAVDFDFSSWAEEYGAGTITLEIMRASDTAPYTPLLSIDGTTARWTISDVDTARRGPGVAQFIYTPVDKRKKSAVFKFYVGKSIRSDDDTDPWQDLLNRLEELLGEMQQQAADTRENAEAADQSAQDAATSESNAEAWAVGERGGEPVPATDPTFENSAKYYAGRAAASETAAEEAEAAAAQSESNAAASAAGAAQSQSGAAASETAAAGSATAAAASAATAQGHAASAASSASAASGSATSARDSERNAAASASAAAQSARDAAASANGAAQSQSNAAASKTDAEAWAVGERDGEPVGEGDPTYENNAKYWAEKAMTDAPVTSVNGQSGDVDLDLDDIPDGETYVRATPEQLAQIEKNAADIADVEQTTTETTVGPSAIATFNASAADMPLKGLTVNIEPVQAAGTPSPDNPLPISGWTGVNVFDDPKHALKINWNQIRTDSAQTRTLDGITTEYDPQTHLFTITNNSRTTNFGTGSTQCVVSNVNPIPGHKYALLGEYHAGVAVSAVNGSALRTTASVGRILTMSATTPNTGFKLRITSSYDFVSAHPVGDVYSFYLNIVDITQLLGEEAAATATYDQIAEMFPNDWYPYNAGEITCVSAVNGDPYQKIAVNWEDEAGTVYGGTLTINADGSGKLISDVGYMRLPSTWSWYRNQLSGSYYFGARHAAYTLENKLLACTHFKSNGTTVQIGTNENHSVRIAVDRYYQFNVRYDEFTEVADFKSFLENNEVYFAYKILSPDEFHFNNLAQLTTLLGTNNIWADCGDVTVTYGAYLETVKAYADKVGDSILSAIAPLETSYTASRAYTVGSFLFVGTKFYKVTAAIAEGGTITPDTNVTQTTVAEQLMALANT